MYGLVERKIAYTDVHRIITQRFAPHGIPERWHNPNRSNPLVCGKVVAWGHGCSFLKVPCTRIIHIFFSGLEGL